MTTAPQGSKRRRSDSNKPAKSLQRAGALAVDLGGTLLRVAVVTPSGRVAARTERPTPRDPTEIVQAVADLAEQIIGSFRVAVAGVAAPGPLDPVAGIVHYMPHIKGFEAFPLVDELRDVLRVPVVMHNDANLAALGEYRYGAGRGHDPLVYLTVSTGVGGGIIRDGAIEAGRFGLAGELGHMIIAAGGPACTLGHRGCLEALASGTALSAAARRRLATGAKSSLQDRFDDTGPTAAAIAAAADDGDALATSLMADVGRWLGLAAGSLINALDPSRIVIGGGVTHAWHLFAPEMERAAAEIIMAREHRAVAIVRAATGADAGLLGAAAYAFARSDDVA